MNSLHLLAVFAGFCAVLVKSRGTPADSEATWSAGISFATILQSCLQSFVSFHRQSSSFFAKSEGILELWDSLRRVTTGG